MAAKKKLLHLIRGILLQLMCLSLPRLVQADGISGFMEYSFSQSESKTEDAAGTSGKTAGTALMQRYNLSLDRTLYPHLTFSAGGNIELNRSDFEMETGSLSNSLASRQTRLSPFANLRFNNGIVSAGTGYSRRQEITRTAGAPSFTSINDTYNAQLGFRPQGLPAIDTFYTHIDLYDADRSFQNSANDSVTVTARYSLLKNLDLTYQVLFSNLQDKLRDQEITSLNQNARIAYNDTFWRSRVSLYSTYNISSQSTRIHAADLAQVMIPVVPVHGYFKIIDTSVVSSVDPLNSGALDLFDPLVSGSANTPIAFFNVAGLPDTRTRNFGIELPPRSSVNVIRLLVDQDISGQNIPAGFTWSLYTSENGIDWTFERVVPGVFNKDFGDGTRGFEFRFPTITTPGSGRLFLKIVTTPVSLPEPLAGSPGVAAANVVRLQAFAPASARENSSISGHYEMNSRVRIFDKPSVFYDLNFTLDHFNADTGSSQRYFVTNSLSLTHQFSSIYSTSGRITREDSFDPSAVRSAWVYSASLTAVPVPALTSSLLFSGRNEDSEGATTSSYSLFLNNTAELYRGINVFLNGGVSRGISAIDRRSDNAIFIAGANLVPHPKANINLSVSGKKEWSAGGGLPDTTSYKQDNEISFTLTPFRSAYLFGSLAVTTETDKKTQLIRTLGGSWAPFREGNLLYNISYNESAASQGSQETRSLVNSLRWYFRSSSYFDLSYLITRSSSTTQQIDSYSLNAAARFTF
ncbi:hypothetical protein [Geobacter sp. DSM 9736]|uniref:hypothetical protein n=1 Tax=Geobacter sp. DSM 9736 TaxID=1277350 RepID=UPI0012FD7C9C|nr:hypothetical protein [Geobacter sp. DSM 9736]